MKKLTACEKPTLLRKKEDTLDVTVSFSRKPSGWSAAVYTSANAGKIRVSGSERATRKMETNTCSRAIDSSRACVEPCRLERSIFNTLIAAARKRERFEPVDDSFRSTCGCRTEEALLCLISSETPGLSSLTLNGLPARDFWESCRKNGFSEGERSMECCGDTPFDVRAIELLGVAPSDVLARDDFTGFERFGEQVVAASSCTRFESLRTDRKRADWTDPAFTTTTLRLAWLTCEVRLRYRPISVGVGEASDRRVAWCRRSITISATARDKFASAGTLE